MEIIYIVVYSHTCRSFHIINIPKQIGVFVVIDERALTHDYHPQSIIILEFTLGVSPSAGLDGSMISYIHQDSSIQSPFVVLKTLHHCCISLLCAWFYLFQNAIYWVSSNICSIFRFFLSLQYTFTCTFYLFMAW